MEYIEEGIHRDKSTIKAIRDNRGGNEELCFNFYKMNAWDDYGYIMLIMNLILKFMLR